MADGVAADEVADFFGEVFGVIAGALEGLGHEDDLQAGLAMDIFRVLDMTYREDESRIREKALRENFAWLNRFTLSLLKQHPYRMSLAMKRRSCGWDENFLLEVVTGSTC